MTPAKPLWTSAKREALLFLLALLFVSISGVVSESSYPCQSDSDCQSVVSDNSKCDRGFCTNPYHYGGCLDSLLPEWKKKRVCGSDDPPEAIEQGYCRQSPWNDHYMEIRILGQDWESSWFSTWILQILLSEILEVPVSIEQNARGLNLDFYNIENRLDYDLEWGYADQIVQGNTGDCRLLKSKDPEPYVSCGHVIPEIWGEDAGAGIDGSGPLRETGALGSNQMFVPRFTMERDPSLVTYTGLGGEENREKLASVFKRPTNWKDYCNEVSQSNCASPDETAVRAPMDEVEEQSYFVEGLYWGHFRATEENDCVNNTDCTGSIVDFPCNWGSHTIQQTHHLGIALKGSGDDVVGGYQIDFLPQIYAAANWTKSDVVMVWWYPDPLYDKYIGTDAEMTKVILPPPTQKCVDARAPVDSRCTNDLQTNIGSPGGACDYDPQFLKKAMSQNLYDFTHSPDLPEPLWSPAYDTVANFQISHLQLGEIFVRTKDMAAELGDFASRHAVCHWFVDNLEEMLSFIPPTYPRKFQIEDTTKSGLFVTALVAASLAILLVILLLGATYHMRKTTVVYYAQPEFLVLLLLGLFLVSIGALCLALPPTDSLCVSVPWLVNIGLAVQFVPVLYRIYAISKLASKGKAMQRVRLKAKHLYFWTAVGVGAVCTYVVVWTIVDPLIKTFDYDLTEEITTDGETIVAVFDTCGSEADFWIYISLGWQGFVIVASAMVSVIASAIKEDLNDTMTMSRMIYTHLLFLLLRVIAYTVLTEDFQTAKLMGYQSLLLSTDSLVAMLVYILPKFLSRGAVVENEEPLPDLFLNTSIMVADVTGFTAWSSVREPVQVFKFLEQLYESLDKVAAKHNVFKVETVREQYVAATGIPDAQADHALAIARFASDCLKKMDLLSKQLEVQYGPDTADVSLRIGIHSGPVTGGFTKGKGGRFQLFGDTMTTTSLIHAHGEVGKIHLSETTANLLIKLGRKRWVSKRESPIEIATKGTVQTYWLTRGRQGSTDGDRDGTVSNVASSHDGSSDNGDLLTGHDDSEKRWVDFNVEILKNLIKQIVVQRDTARRSSLDPVNYGEDADYTMPLEEVKEIIELPDFDKRALKRSREKGDFELDEIVVEQLRNYVGIIASMYNPNPFHNFAHASYVVMAIQKFLNRILAGKEIDLEDDRNRTSSMLALHQHTYGITSDPLTQFACVFSALIHDVDHPGVPNPRLIVENERMASVYKKRSVAEQKSFDVAWDILMEPSFDALRQCICSDDKELKRFRQLVINSVMATDLGDAELKELRNRRWARAFTENESSSSAALETERDAMNRKATIVIEHLIQAADVAHTCQHWSIYRKWNERLFEECYQAYVDGRAEKNPADTWYQGELGFFDFYIIPLSQKLRDCGVFGPTSDENLDYAKSNRSMWEKEGKAIVAEMLQKVENKHTVEERETTATTGSHGEAVK